MKGMRLNMKPWEKGKLTTSGRYFFNGDTPFFWLGDTAWRLFQCLNMENSHKYLQNRVDKGYTLIKAVLLAHVRYNDEREGRTPLLDENMDIFLSPVNEPYWQHVEAVVKMAQDMGLYMMLIPTWGDYAKIGFLNKDNAAKYMEFLANRFNKFENIIWSLGGDIRGGDHAEMWDICGNTLRKLSPNKLIGFHPFGRTSSTYWFNDRSWLDFNMFQSGHRRYDQRNLNQWDEATGKEPWYGEDSYKYVEADLAKTPLRPVLDGEPSYEQIPQGLHDRTQPFWEAHHVRRYAWWPVLTGAGGHTYGSNAVMQMFGLGTNPAFHVREGWEEAMHHEGAGQMRFLKDLMLEIDYTNCQPMQEVLDDRPREKEYAIRIFGNDKNIVAYIYNWQEFTLTAPKQVDAWWFDPATGTRSYFGKFDLAPGVKFTPPIKKTGHNDWVLLLKSL